MIYIMIWSENSKNQAGAAVYVSKLIGNGLRVSAEEMM